MSKSLFFKTLFLNFFLCSIFINAQKKKPTLTEIAITGLNKSKKSFIGKLINSQVEMPVDSLQIQKDVLRLIRQPAVSHATFKIQKINDSLSKLIINVKENHTLIPALDLWRTLNNKIAYLLGINDYNFLGRGYVASVFFRKNIYNGYGFIFGNPNFINYKIGYKIIGQYNKTLEPITNEGDRFFYNYTNQSFEFYINYEFNLNNNLSVGVGKIYESYAKEPSTDLSTLPNNFKTNKNIVKLSYDYDFLNYYYYQTYGIRNTFNINYVVGKNISNEQTFVSFENIFFYFKKVGSLANWANRIKLGISTNSPTPFQIFALDNNRNIRGIGNLIRRGSAIWSFNSEYRYTLIEKKWFVLQTNSFIDIGSVRIPGQELDVFLKNQSVEYRVGIGVRLIHKYIFNAILRIDYGFDFNQRGGLVFGLGQYF